MESYIVEWEEKKQKERQQKEKAEEKVREEQNKAAHAEVQAKIKEQGAPKPEEKKKVEALEDEAKMEELSERKKSLVKKKLEVAVAKGPPRFHKKKSHRNFAKKGKKSSKHGDASSVASSRAEDASQLSEV